MNGILGISKSGIHAFQDAMNTIAHDIANVNTTSYKSKQVQFEKLIENTHSNNNKILLHTDLQEVRIASGVKSNNNNTLFTQGNLSSSEGSYQLAITGEGFFKVRNEDGQEYLTRDGDFQINENRTITNSSGDQLEIQTNGIAQENWPAGDVVVQGNGTILIHTKNGTVSVGRILLYKPENKESLTTVGGNKYAFSTENLLNSLQNVEEFGSIQSQHLENSNVDLASRMTEMIVAQRAYSMNLKAVQNTDEMMGMVNNFKQ